MNTEPSSARIEPAFAVRRSSIALAGLFVLVAGGLNALAATNTFQSTSQQTSLLELYTSEGCSSCPPAESWLSHQKDAPGLWTDFVPVAFHVDYWDHLGWRDPWSSKSYTLRQRTYSEAWGTDTIYTPEFILNGSEWRDWSRARAVPRPEASVGVLTVSPLANDRWKVDFAPARPAGRYQVHAALLSSGMSSDVKAGENQGRHLAHDFVVGSLTQVPMEKSGDLFQAEITVGPERRLSSGRLALAVWVTRDSQLEVLQATGGWLQPLN